MWNLLDRARKDISFCNVISENSTIATDETDPNNDWL